MNAIATTNTNTNTFVNPTTPDEQILSTIQEAYFRRVQEIKSLPMQVEINVETEALHRPGIRGAELPGVLDQLSFLELIENVGRWSERQTTEEHMRVFEGYLPKGVTAYAAASTLDDACLRMGRGSQRFMRVFRGPAGKKNYRLTTNRKIPTSVITVQICTENNSLIRWFPGRDVNTMIVNCLGATPVYYVPSRD